ncbi:hypothetical protein ACWCQZ_40590 [Streptomyces sp. NPDC002285]
MTLIPSADRSAFNQALNHEAARVLVSGGCPPATKDALFHVVSLGFQLGIHPEVTLDNPRVLIMILAPRQLTGEEDASAAPDREAQESVLTERAKRLQAEKAELRAACAESLREAGWAIGERGPFMTATAPREAVFAALSAVLAD